ncbi:MAG: YjfB family protein [Defluviitaleaceae bacterium]|nr:YjfB family protein [Defluviitaleaceae bacterium]
MDIMGAARLSTAMAEQNVMREVNMSLMRMSMDHAEQTGELVADLMQSMPLPVPPVGFDGIGMHVDIFI